ncbi:MAG: FAD-dependent thymidylate synthase [Chloroflexota bacterium]|nr:FAD-dependent thymidylate synthase [Chloroflexota bacterium]
MQVELLAYTQRNPALTPASVAGFSDLAALWQGKGTYAENIMEYAGRVCYLSTQRMGTAPDFISARVREGHEDIIEHVVITVRITGTDEPLRWRMLNRHCEVSELGGGEWVVSGNARVWLDFFRRGIALAALPLVRPIAPAIFAELATTDERPTTNAHSQDPVAIKIENPSLLLPVQAGPMRVTLLGFTQPGVDDPDLWLHHGAAVFFFEGISRTCTHQLVRHRLGSFSQESQRYISLEKGGWKAVTPPAIAENAAAATVLNEFWQLAETKYEELRELGMRKEDSRFLLPNAAETRIITSMNFAAWSHFLWLRAVDKAAQWEIRAMSQCALEMLYTIAPTVFQKHWEVYQEQFVNAKKPKPRSIS